MENIHPSKNYKEPVINFGKIDKNLSKKEADKIKMANQWFIYFSVWDYENHKWKPQKYYGSILNNKAEYGNSLTKRLSNATDELMVVTSLLKGGINPVTRTRIKTPEIEKFEEAEKIGAVKGLVIIPTFLQAKEQYLNKLKKAAQDFENSRNSYKTYKSVLTAFENYLRGLSLDTVPINKIQPRIVKNYMEEKLVSGYWTLRTYYNNYGFLRTFFNDFADLLQENPAKHSRKKKEKIKSEALTVENGEVKVNNSSRRFNAFSLEMAKDILNKLDEENPNLALICRFIFYTLIRPAELKRLRMKHFDFEKKVIFLPNNITKNARNDYVDIDPPLLNILETYLENKEFRDNDFIFSFSGKPDKNPITDHSTTMAFTTFLRKHKDDINGLNDPDTKYSLYSWKHTGAVQLMRDNWPVSLIQRRCRHKTEGETQNYLRDLMKLTREDAKPERSII